MTKKEQQRFFSVVRFSPDKTRWAMAARCTFLETETLYNWVDQINCKNIKQKTTKTKNKSERMRRVFFSFSCPFITTPATEAQKKRLTHT